MKTGLIIHYMINGFTAALIVWALWQAARFIGG